MVEMAHAAEAERANREAEATVLEAEMARVCGVINSATGRLVDLIARVLATGAWEGWGIHSPEHWVGWKCGVGAGRARALVAMARRLGELPTTMAALQSGELSEDQVGVVCRHVPAAYDAEVADFAKLATVGQLRRTLSTYRFVDPKGPDGGAEPEAGNPDPEEVRPEEARPEEARPEETRTVDFGFTDSGSWRLSALLPPDEGALVEKALSERRQALFSARGPQADHLGPQVSWADALVGVADASLSHGGRGRAQRDRYRVLVHVRADEQAEAEGRGGTQGHLHHAHLHRGPALPDGLRRYLGCDATARVVYEAKGRPVSVGRATKVVPDRTRVVVEDRDRGCRVPGCERKRWLHIHHVVHWEDGGPTDTANLLALCGAHHRMHHQGRLGITGDADQPDGIVFADHRGRVLASNGRPVPPGDPPLVAAGRLGIPEGAWDHPLGERIDSRWVYFNESRVRQPPAPVPAEPAEFEPAEFEAVELEAAELEPAMSG